MMFNKKNRYMHIKICVFLPLSAMPEKLTYQAVLDRFRDEGCTLLSKEYLSMSDPLEYVCRCGNTEFVSLKIFGKRPRYKCSKCPDKKEFPKRLSYEQVVDIFQAKNCELISDKYSSSIKPLQFLCSCGSKETCSIILSSFRLYGTNCQACRADRAAATMIERYGVEFNIKRDGFKDKMLSGIAQYVADKKHSYDFVKSKFQENSLDLLDSEYKHLSSKLQYKCQVCFHEGFITFEKLYHRNQGCGNVSCVNDKRIATSQLKYGTNHPSQSSEVSESNHHTSFRYSKYIMPSGKEIFIQGFEFLALDLLLETFRESQIQTERTKMPEIWYSNGDGMYKRYFCDIFIADLNLIVEVKSTYTYRLDFKKNDYKRKACEYAGYRFKLMLFDDKKKLISDQSFLRDIE